MESSLEAFADQLQRGFGLEFDLQLSKDRQFVVSHDPTLERFSAGKDTRPIRDLTLAEILALSFNGYHLISLGQLLNMIKAKQQSGAISALHLKHTRQNQPDLDLLLRSLDTADQRLFIIFDLTPKNASYLKARDPSLLLAPSVAHPYDIVRFGQAVGGTLISSEEAIANRHLFDWVWLDEWDRTDAGGKQKTFYTKEIFAELRTHGFSIALVTPELHGTSPGLLGGEKHPDASPPRRLYSRLAQIASLKPDAICTDFPDLMRSLV